MKSIRLQTIIFILSFLFANNSYSQLIIDSTTIITPTQLIQNVFVGGCATVSNVTSSGNIPIAISRFSTGSNPTNLGLTEGIIMSTGNVSDAPGPNTSGSTSTTNGTGSDTLLASLIPGYTIYDACYLQFDFVPNIDTIKFRYVFGSEEYPEWVGSSFNDVFGFFITGINPDGGSYNNKNIAVIPGTTLPVTIDNINSGSHSQYYINNGDGTTPQLNPTIQYDGFTKVLTAWCKVTPGTQYSIKIAVGDAGDTAYDTAVFLEAGSFSAGGAYTDSLFSAFTVTSPVCTGNPSTITYTGNASPNATYSWNFDGGNIISGSGKGPYQVSWTNDSTHNITLTVIANVCQSLQTIVPVVVKPTPTSTFTVVSPLCHDSITSVMYTGNASANATYTWNFDGGTIISGSGMGPYQVSWSDIGTHYVRLLVIENGCQSLTTIVPVVVTQFAGISSIVAANPVPIYPNPSTGVFTLDGIGTAFIYNILGACISTKEVIGATSFNLTGHAKGIYLVKFVDRNNNNSVQKVVIQ